MPLLSGKENQGRNIAELIHSGKPKDQAIAISYDILKRKKKNREKFLKDTYEIKKR